MKTCTCTGTCKGKEGLAPGWRCALEPLPPARGCASPGEILLLCYKAKQLEMCKDMLDAAGVPEWVYLERNKGVPSNSTPCRLHWYLARRKDVTKKEALQGCTLEMKRILANVKARHNDRTQPRGPETL